MFFELRYYNGSKHLFNHKKEYLVCSIYQLKETKNQFSFQFTSQKFNDPRIPEKQNLKFSKNKGWTLEKLTEPFYPQQAGIPFWFVEII